MNRRVSLVIETRFRYYRLLAYDGLSLLSDRTRLPGDPGHCGPSPVVPPAALRPWGALVIYECRRERKERSQAGTLMPEAQRLETLGRSLRRRRCVNFPSWRTGPETT